MSENYPHPVNISKAGIEKLRQELPKTSKNGDGYSYEYDPDAESQLNASNSMENDAWRLKHSPSATDLANRARR